MCYYINAYRNLDRDVTPLYICIISINYICICQEINAIAYFKYTTIFILTFFNSKLHNNFLKLYFVLYDAIVTNVVYDDLAII